MAYLHTALHPIKTASSPKVLGGSPVWRTGSQHILRLLELAYRGALRWVIGLPSYVANLQEAVPPGPGAATAVHTQLQSLCKSLGEKVRAKPPQNQCDELLLSITPPPMGKTTHHELSQVEKGMIIALFWFFRKISIISLITGRPWSTVKNFLQRATERGHVDNLPRSWRPEKLTKRECGTSGERLSPIESLPESNYMTSVHLMCP